MTSKPRLPLNNPRTDFMIDRGAQELVEARVLVSPDSPALEMDGLRISYRALNEHASRLAHYLRAQGAGPGTIIGVLVDRSVEMVVCLLGILKSGAVYLPLDPKFPEDRLAFMLRDAEVPILLTQAALKESLPQSTATVVFVEELFKALENFSLENPDPIHTSSDAAYVIYTSGSTGKPKGVMIPHRALTNFLLSMAEQPGITADDTLLAVTTISFDISLLEMLLPLSVGAKIVVASRAQTADPYELRRLLDEHGITTMQATPTTWRLLLESGWKGRAGLKILCGGEALTQDLAERLLPCCGELWNMYGPTETTIWSSTERVLSPNNITLGLPIANTELLVVDEQMRPVASGEAGELLIGGSGLALSYLKREELTAQKFIADTISGVEGARLYRTGDEVRLRADGALEFLGRLDHQIKLNGFRIELGEIETALARMEGIRQAVVLLREDVPGDKRLVAYYTGEPNLDVQTVLASLRASLPEYMLPSSCVWMAEFPQTPNAKLDRKALPAPTRKRPQLAQPYIAPSSEFENKLSRLWQELLKVDGIGIDDSFFDLGGNSIAVFRMVSACRSRFAYEVPPVKVFQYPTIAQLRKFVESSENEDSPVSDAERRGARLRADASDRSDAREAVAVVGMAGRFPGAGDLEQLWRNLCEGRESISFFEPGELGPGIEERLRHAPDYVRARGIIEGAELFDASFFGISPLEAKVSDPQQRVFLELAHHALENAGYDPLRYKGLIGVYAGVGDNHYYTTNLLTHPELLVRAGKLAVEYGNEKDYIALRTAYLLDLRGPAVSMNTACSTTLLAIDLAYRALRDYECDIALAGGIDIGIPQKSGFIYTEGGTFARDGHCKPFDADATGTMFCDGAGIVVLKRLSDALKDGDTIYAVIEGSGKNNNGSRPASFLAPSVEGQAEAIALAQAAANIDIENIGYIEAHGTGTPVGDPIEVQALSIVFQRKTQKKQFCAIGSIKGNIGHPTNAAGVAGFIKAALVLDREQIPATLHYITPNPRIDFARSPFRVADRLIAFPRTDQPRYTAVSSFGFGGTNVHIILGEAPARTVARDARPMQLLPVSARTPAALDALSASLSQHFQSAQVDSLADGAFTLQVGRRQMAMRRFVVAGSTAEAAQFFALPDPRRGATKRCERRDPPIAFLFGGQGTQYVNMGQNLYAGEPLFRAVVDHCCEILKPHLGRDLRELLYPKPGDDETARASLQDTFYTQPSLFVIEYALARFWESLGIRPAIMVGHSIGEFVAATLAGVWELEDVLRIVALRGRLMQSLPRGTMMAVRAGVDAVAPRLSSTVQVASNNAPSLCVISGPDADVQMLREQLEADKIICRPLHTSHAFHSAMMDPMVEPLRAEIAKVQLRAPSLPFVSTVTGELITEVEATSPAYWAHQARATVQFSKAASKLKELGHDLFLECGPRATLCALVRQHFAAGESCVAIPTLPDTHENNQEWTSMLFALGSLWLQGTIVDWDAFYANEDRRRIPLPGYPFERQRYWVDPAESSPRLAAPQHAVTAAEPSAPAEIAVSSPQPVAASTRKERLCARIVDLISPISGHESGQLSTSSLFVEQGFDSLSLAQVSVEIDREFGIKIGFSKLMNDFPTVEMVAAHLESVLPPEAFTSAPAVPVSPPVTSAQTNLSPQHAGPTDPSVQALANAVAEQGRILASIQQTLALLTQKSGGTAALPALKAEEGAPSCVPATIPQRGIFYSSRLSDHLSASYNESVTLEIAGKIDEALIRRALERLVARHDALRATFDAAGAEMRIASAAPLHVNVADLSSVPIESQAQQLRDLARKEAARAFPLPTGPFFRASIVQLGTQAAAVILTVHHIICDGWSIDVLIQDFCRFYSEDLSGTQEPMPPAPSFVAYAAMAHRRAQGPEFEAARAYWARKFSQGLPALALPADLPRKPVREHRAIRIDRTFPTTKVEQARAVAAEQGVSLFAVNVAALAILLAKLARQPRFVLALSTAEQPFLGQTQLVGHCVSLMPFLVELRPDEELLPFVRRIQHELAEATDHLSFTTVHLMEELVSTSRTRISPIPVGLTGIKKFRPDELDLRGYTLDYFGNPKSFESFEWYLSAMESGDGLEVHGHYDVELFREETIVGWLRDYEAIFTAIAEHSPARVFELAQLGDADALPAPVLFTLVEDSAVPDDSIAVNAASSSVPVVSLAAGADDTRPDYVSALTQLYRRILGNRAIGPDDNFFDLGGHSVNAARLFAMIERELHITAPLAALYEASTPRALAKVLDGGIGQERWQSLVPIQTGGDRPPLFLMHGAEGNVLLYRVLAHHLGADQPVYGLQSAGLDGRSPVESNLRRAAHAYVEEIRAVQPHGPYLLGGYCLGGVLAMEMARELMQQGQTVGLVAMIEIFNIRSTRWPLPWHVRTINRFLLNPYYHAANVLAADGRSRMDFFRQKLNVERARARVQTQLAWSRVRRLLHMGAAEEFHHVKIADVWDRALEEHDVTPYPGEITLFTTEHRLMGMDAPLDGWTGLADSIREIRLPFNPKASLTEPFVGIVAQQLRGCIDEAIAKHASAHEGSSVEETAAARN